MKKQSREDRWGNSEDAASTVSIVDKNGNPVHVGSAVQPEAIPLPEGEEFVGIATGEKSDNIRKRPKPKGRK